MIDGERGRKGGREEGREEGRKGGRKGERESLSVHQDSHLAVEWPLIH